MRSATRWRPRSTTCSPAAPAPTCSTAPPALAAAPAVAALLGAELGWDADEIERQVDDYRLICESEQHASAVTKPNCSPTMPDRPQLNLPPASGDDDADTTDRTDGIRRAARGRRRAAPAERCSTGWRRSARRSPTDAPWPRPVATGGRSRCTGRSPGWSLAWPPRSCDRRPRPRWRRSSPPATTRGSRSPRPVAAAECRGASVPIHGGVVLDTTALAGIGAVDVDVGRRRGGCRNVRARSRVRAAGRARPHCRALPAELRPGDGRRMGRLPGRRSVLDRATARSRTWSSGSRWCWPTAP